MSIVCMKIVLPDDATLLSGRTRPCPQWWRANQAQCQPLIYTDYIQESIRYKFCSLRRAKPTNNLFNQTSAPLSTLLLTFCLTQNSRNTQNYLSLSRWFTLALDSTEWHSFHCACLAGCQLMCFVFIRFHRASRRDEVCDKFCGFIPSACAPCIFTYWIISVDSVDSVWNIIPSLTQIVSFPSHRNIIPPLTAHR